MAQGLGLDFKPHYTKKKKKKKKDGEIHFLTPGIQSQTGFTIDFDQKIQ
jgi:hypothetical protein